MPLNESILHPIEKSSDDFEGLSTPLDWNPDNAIYSSNYIEKPGENLDKINESNGVSTFIDKNTGNKTESNKLIHRNIKFYSFLFNNPCTVFKQR